LQVAPPISVVIPAFRAASTIARTLASCLQDIPGRNVIVVLDGPDDALEDVVRSATDRTGEGVQVIVRPQQGGASTCRNLGLERVETEYVLFLDADDYTEPGTLVAVCAAAKEGEADIVFGLFCHEMPCGSRRYRSPDAMYKPLTCANVVRQWLLEDYTPPCAVVWRTAFVRSLGGWDETLRKNQDGDLMLRALLAEARLGLAHSGLSLYSQGDNPDRVTRKHDAGTLDSQFTVLEKLRKRLPALPFDPAYELGFSYYNLARLAYTHGFVREGRCAEAAARSLGITGHPGSRGHAFLASVMSLAGKQLLAYQVRKILRKLKGKSSAPAQSMLAAKTGARPAGSGA